ncbi:uncharacterized protein M421DRAFT_416738 [Didymella exigua CBS 183.55]|uniref:RING-type domain-containing protein n=1 Tax=Didymella exigua CBS 183.55 TaxID=1150837 RepID=A0A6A5RXD6_9PLEO|nr:uncharacterized protein M421DRAFT_416738 [Didymella exigua CBS 183.55]KAF1932010.1 hypothetical protein M421DRAFT_416738 [Didymella exigua CBS 183.55]
MAILAVPDLSQHPALRHPQPVTRDTAKAQRMLGLLAESAEAKLFREKSITTRWLERPLYAHLDVSDVESEKESDDDSTPEAPKTHTRQDNHLTKEYNISPVVPQKQWTKPERPSPASFDSVEAVQKLVEPRVSKLEKSFDIKRVESTDWMPPSYNREEIQSIASYSSSPEWAALSNTLKQHARQQRPVSLRLDSANLLAKPTLSSTPSFSSFGKDEPDLRLMHPQTWGAPPAHPAQTKQPKQPQHSEPYDSGRESFESIEKPWLEGRPRPMSFASYHSRNRSKTKIASSRSSRLNTYPNFSRKMSGENPDNLVDQHYDRDTTYGVQETHWGEGAVVASPVPVSAPPFERKNTFERIGGRMLSDEEKELEKEKAAKAEKGNKAKNRWSTIPNLLKFAKPAKRASNANELDRAAVIEGFRCVSQNVPEVNNQASIITHRYSSYNEPIHSEAEPTPLPDPQSQLKPLDFLPTPQHSPLAMSFDKSPRNSTVLPPPFAPWAGTADPNATPPSPPASISNPLNNPQRRKSSNPLLSPGHGYPSPLSPSSPREMFESRPTSLHSHRSSTFSSHMATSSTSRTSASSAAPSCLSFISPTVMTAPQPPFASSSTSTPRRGTPMLERTCLLCKASKPMDDFNTRRITANCWHETSTCMACMQAWVENSMDRRERCVCPECSENMSYEDVGAFAVDALGGRADGRHWV